MGFPRRPCPGESGEFRGISRDTILILGGTGRVVRSVRLDTTLSESSVLEHAVNVRTLSPGRSAPADRKKDANGFDLPIALGLLLASGQVALDRPGNYAIVGELALTGDTRPIKGILAMALQAVSEGRDGLLVPTANAAEAAVVEGLNVYPVGSLAEAVGFLTGQVDMDPEAVDLDDLFAQHSHMEEDFVDVKGQDYTKRALLIAAAGSRCSQFHPFSQEVAIYR